MALECVAGDMPGRVMQAMVPGSTLISYGLLSKKNIGPINPVVMIFKNQRIEPFLLGPWLKTKNML